MNRRTNSIRLSVHLALAALLGCVGSTAVAATTYFNSTTCGNSNTIATCNSNTSVNSVLTVSGYSNSAGQSVNPTASTTYREAEVWSWGSGGLGIVNLGTTASGDSESSGAAGPHAIDNAFGNDALLLSFVNKSNLTSLSIGWDGTENGTAPYNDSDLAIYYWNGAGTPVQGPVSGDTRKSLVAPTSSGWTLVGNYCDVGNFNPDTVTLATTNTCTGQKAAANNAGAYSSYWLVTGYGQTSTNYDAFKVVSVGSTQCSGGNCNQTPEPGTLALMALAAAGMVGVRRRSSFFSTHS